MKIGLISDIHANRPALAAVLADMPPVDEVVCAGDVVGYNPMPSVCVERVQEVASTTVQGNHDRTVENTGRYRANQMAYAGLEYAQNDSRMLNASGYRIPLIETFGEGDYLLVHSHPENRGEYVYPRNFPELRPHLDDY